MWDEFHPDHKADLERSGLSYETCQAAGLYSVPPRDMQKILPASMREKVSSLLAIPYPETNGFMRYKLFPALDGMKYYQKRGTGVHLYRPRLFRESDGQVYITEGEKKALRLCQDGFPCAAVGGLWNWRREGALLEEIKSIKGAVCFIPDSDVYERVDLLRAVESFGRELEALGRKFTVRFICPK